MFQLGRGELNLRVMKNSALRREFMASYEELGSEEGVLCKL